MVALSNGNGTRALYGEGKKKEIAHYSYHCLGLREREREEAVDSHNEIQ